MPSMKPSFGNRRQSKTTDTFKVGDKIRAVAAFGHHSYEPGRCYTVTSVDSNDKTLKARDVMGQEGNWIKWRDCKKANDIAWDWLKSVLPAEALDLLAAFDGLEHLTLREDLRNRLVLQIPGLHDKILIAMAEEEAPEPGLLADSADTGTQNDLPDFEDFD
jgi:hypothetical protein